MKLCLQNATVKQLILRRDFSWLGPKDHQMKYPPIPIALISLVENITKLSKFIEQSICPENKIKLN